MKPISRLVALMAAVTLTGLLVARAGANGERFVVYGADTTDEERIELALLFGADGSVPADLVTTPEMVEAVRGTGLAAAVTDQSISSSMLTCLNQGEGLTVRTENITRIPAPVYANALITAGVGDGRVLIAAPAAKPVTGESALVGVLKVFPQCQAGAAPDPARVALAYEQIARTTALAGQFVDLSTASAAILEATQPVLLGEARHDAQIGATLDEVMQRSGVPLDPVNRADLVDFLKQVAQLDYGAYAKGYQVQQVSPTEVRVTPSGAGTPAVADASTAPAAAPTPAASTPVAAAPAPAAAPVAAAPTPAATTTAQAPGQTAPQQGTAVIAPVGDTFAGEVRATGDALTVRSNGGERRVAVGPNVVVTRNGKPATLAELRRGDAVSVTTNPDGSTQRIDAEARRDAGAGPWAWLAPLLLGLLLLGLLYWLVSRRREPFILQRSK